MNPVARAAAQPRQPRPPAIKPDKTIVNPAIHQTERITVKFKDGLTIRLRDGRLTDLNSGALKEAAQLKAAVGNGTWERSLSLPEDRLGLLRSNAEINLGKEVADLNLQFNLFVPDGADAAKTIDALNALDCVEIALPIPRPMAPPTPPNYQSNQGYLNAGTSGVNALCMWQLPGGTGGNSALADIEYSWNLNHQDLSTATLLGATPVDPFSDDNHGTGVLGEIGALSNGWGVTGIAYGSTLYVVAANTSTGYDVGAAITTALGTLTAGDVILIEQQIAGPNYTGSPPGTQYGLVPVEWYQPYYNAIVTAVGNGVVVVEAAGNGSQDLDNWIYSTGNGGHWPFLPANDSGAIIVGAGASPGGSDTDRSRLAYSNYGSTLDLQGWGENVYTTCCGDLYSAEGRNLWFTSGFGGTSSASPIVAGACLLLQSATKAATGSFLTPGRVRFDLRGTGSPQQAGTYPTSQNIGPRPNASAALCYAVAALDANSNFVPDLCEGLPGIEACCFSAGGCTDTTPTNCTANGGTPQGSGTSCATTMCLPPEACCFPGQTPTCTDMPPNNCQMSGGLSQGPGTTCMTMQCQVMVPKFSQLPTPDRENIASDIDVLSMNPNMVVADDFQSDGRPITVVRWWGSYLDPRYLPIRYGGQPTPFQIDGWLISFHEPLTAGSGSPPAPALGLYFANAVDVNIMPTILQACDGHSVFQYTVEIKRCCLLFAMPDSRSGWIPARSEAFEEQHCFVYDIDIQAVVGATYLRNQQNGMCVQMPSQKMATGDFWGWHATDNENGFRQAMRSATTPAPVGGPWLYGPWSNVMPVCGPPLVNMAFELLTINPQVPPPCIVACCFVNGTCTDMIENNCIMMGGDPQGPGSTCATVMCEIVVPKFEQSPTADHENIRSNVDLLSMVPNTVIADDFQSDGRPITRLQWWGSYFDSRYLPIEYGGQPTPFQIDGWLISFHEPLSGTQPLPQQSPLALYFVQADDILINPTAISSCDGHQVYEYFAKLNKACLLHAQPDSRSGLVPGQPNAFLEEHCFWYDIGIEAVIGRTYTRDPLTGACLQTPTQDHAEGLDFWGWHSTGTENGRHSALTNMIMFGPAGEWWYGPWNSAVPLCSPPPVNMAFALWTTNLVIPPPCPCACPGDMDGSSFIDGKDIQGFVDCILGTVPPGVDCRCADLDGLNGADINDASLFINRLLNNPACP